jgi:5-enolpyruvylshikimate-3-phosphate synthase
MPTNIDPGVVEAVAIGNLKSIAEQPAMLSNLAYSNTVVNTDLAAKNAVSIQQAFNELGVSVLGKTVNMVSNLGPLEAKSAQEILTGNTMGELISNLKAATENLNAATTRVRQ